MAQQGSSVALCISASVVVALLVPDAFLWVNATLVTRMLAGLAFTMGMTAKADDLHACLRRPRPVLLNLAGCFFLMPMLAVALGRLFGLPRGHLIGLVMIGCVNGGTGSNLLTLLANGDVALSVVMTTTTTVGATLATPSMAKFWIGAVVPVDTLGILLSAVRMVLIPTGLGVAASWAAPRLCAAAAPRIPSVALLFAVPLLGSTVAGGADRVWLGGAGLHAAVIGLLLLAALAGYGLSGLTGGGPRECRAMAIEFAVKNIVLASVLLRNHFEDTSTQVPVAAFAFWASLICAAMAAGWGRWPIDEKDESGDAGAWCSCYGA